MWYDSAVLRCSAIQFSVKEYKYRWSDFISFSNLRMLRMNNEASSGGVSIGTHKTDIKVLYLVLSVKKVRDFYFEVMLASHLQVLWDNNWPVVAVEMRVRNQLKYKIITFFWITALMWIDESYSRYHIPQRRFSNILNNVFFFLLLLQKFCPIITK